MEGFCSNAPPGEYEAGSPTIHRPGQEGSYPPHRHGYEYRDTGRRCPFLQTPNHTSPALEAFHPYVYSPALINLDITSDIVDRVPNTMKGAVGP